MPINHKHDKNQTEIKVILTYSDIASESNKMLIVS